MTDWNAFYHERTVTAAQAVNHIKSGETVIVTHAVGEPSALIDALVANKEAYRDLEIIHFVCMGKGEYCLPENSKYFRHNSWFVSPNTRRAVTEGRADFTPASLSQVPGLLRNNVEKLDAFLVHISPPDEHGYCSFGVSVDYSRAAMDRAQMVIAQVNENMPRAHGDCFVHVSEIDYFVVCNDPIIELPLPTITDVEKATGKNCADLIEDGATLQLGIGSMPDAVLSCLKEKKNLGIHSEMISDGVMNLMKEGVVNNKAKTLNKGKTVVTFIMGTKELYEFVHDNPAFQMMPADYVNNPYVIAQNENMVSINSCVAVDFSGQISSESIGNLQISGTGGQVDFVRGATMSRGGKSLIVIPSTAQGGQKSKIVPFLPEGTVVTCCRTDVDCIVTEYGVVSLRGKSVRQRARELIRIAHPKFREELSQAWEAMFQMTLDRSEIGL